MSKSKRCNFEFPNGGFVVDNDPSIDRRAYDMAVDAQNFDEVEALNPTGMDPYYYGKELIVAVNGTRQDLGMVSGSYMGPKVFLDIGSEETYEKSYPVEKIEALADGIVSLMAKEKPLWIQDIISKEEMQEIIASIDDLSPFEELDTDSINAGDYALGIEAMPNDDACRNFPEWQLRCIRRRQYFLVELARKVLEKLKQYKDIGDLLKVVGLSMNFRYCGYFDIEFETHPNCHNKVWGMCCQFRSS